jgi:hypothetical protein
VEALRFCWTVLGTPTGKRLAPMIGELVATLRLFGELDATTPEPGPTPPDATPIGCPSPKSSDASGQMLIQRRNVLPALGPKAHPSSSCR